VGINFIPKAIPIMRQVNQPPLIENDSETPLPDEVTAVLIHMFNGYRRIVIGRQFQSGFSGAAVYLLRPIRPDGAELPTVVKIAPIHLIQQEWQAYQACIHQRLPDIAPIAAEPVHAPNTGWGGLRYPLVGAGQFQTTSLLDYCHQSDPANITYILAERLFQNLRAIWGQQKTLPEFTLRDSYDHLLPVNLLLTATDSMPPSESHLLTPDTLSPSRTWPAGAYVTLQGFRITEIDHERRTLTLNLPLPLTHDGTPRSYRLRLQDVSFQPDNPYQTGQILESLTGRIMAARNDLLRKQLQPVLPGLDLTTEEVSLPDGTVLPNPLLHLDTILKQRFDVRIACVHGDLHLENVLVEYDSHSRITQLIDFGQARYDHILHDLLRLESSVILHLLPPILAENGYPSTLIHTLYQRLHQVTIGQHVLTPPPGLETVFTALLHIRHEARAYLGPTGDWAEYYQGLTLYLLGSLKYGNLADAVGQEAPKAIAFWAAATTQQLVQTGETKMKNTAQHSSAVSSVLLSTGNGRFWLTDWLDQLTGWSNAPAHMRSSWAGMSLWLLDRAVSRFNPERVIILCASLLLWLAAGYLLLPLWGWSATGSTERLLVLVQAGAAFLLLPPLMAWVTRPDYDDLIIRETWRQRGRLYFLKWAGALAGFTVFAWPGLFVSLLWLWSGVGSLPSLLGWSLAGLAILFSYIAARRIPADRYKMYGHKPTLHEADAYIAFALLVSNIAFLLLIYFFYDFLVWRGMAILTLIAILLAAYIQQRQNK
jgi:hypothetical protein